MGYMNEFEEQLRAKLDGKMEEEPDDLVQWLKEQILQSYRNGLAAQKSAKPGADKKPRRFDRKPA